MTIKTRKYFSNLLFKTFPNIGWVEIKLTKFIMDYLKDCIKETHTEHNKKLAGHLSKSYLIADTKKIFFNKVILPAIEHYTLAFGKETIPTILTKDCPFILDTFWVNYQKKYEFNPVHNHTGVFSFVIWMTIPTHYEQEYKVKSVMNSNNPQASDFKFVYHNALGKLSCFNYKLSSKDEGTMLLFPSQLNHAVYPFYTSNKKRISVSGNIFLNPKERA